MMRIPKNEDVTVQCINGKIGYIILSCESDGSWKYNSGICVDDENFVE
jgi:hypothetical protein